MALYTFGQANLRDRAVSITQTVNAAGSVTKVTYTLDDGSTLEDNFTYGPNSTTEPTSVTYGQLVQVVQGTATLTGFTLDATGKNLTYTVAGSNVASLTGFVTSQGVDIPITHTASGAATLASTVSQNATGVTITITSSNPVLATPVTGVAVTNGSTTLVKRALTWTGAVTQTGDSINAAGNNVPALGSYAIDSSKPFRVEGIHPAPTNSRFYNVVIANNQTSLPVWGTVGTNVTAGIINVWDNANSTATVWTNIIMDNGINHGVHETSPGALKWRMISTGNGTVLVQSCAADGTTYTTRRTVTGVSGLQYIKANNYGANQNVEVTVYA